VMRGNVISSDSDTGGLTGELVISGNYSEAYIDKHSSIGNITGTETIGGIIGEVGCKNNARVFISQSYWKGSLLGDEDVGGLLGVVETCNLTISDSYASGPVNSIRTVGGLIGYIFNTNLEVTRAFN